MILDHHILIFLIFLFFYMGVFLERCSLGLLGPGEGRGLLKPLLFIKGLCMHLFHSARQPPVPVSPLQQAWAPRAQKHP